MSNDKKTIGVVAAYEPILAKLISAGHFGSELEAAKFAMAFAISKGVPAGLAEGAATKWNVGTVDADASLRAVIEALYPQTNEPYRLVEFLMNEGLSLMDSSDGLPPDVAGVLFNSRLVTGADA
ncbi:hypothetical protein [Mesorhizobium sp.]|uniref:hypothetical protein n=1 Tax=Mesorhizobium sp. TaxID=1871066 RepID=UPI000FEA3EBF|nr:hypothetical protein [Mesorhizobium sp.]RWP98759.1 MAG: hypothetical protein EOR89_18845 [Mesorhizobium sp.]